MASVGDGMSDSLRDALRAKHRLVEQMKEDVARPGDRRSARRSPFWQIVTIVATVLFLSLAAGGGAAAEKATRAARAAAAERRALERRELKRWSSERALRHFGLRRMSQIAFTDPVRTSDHLYDAVRDPDTHVVVAHVSHSTVMGRKRTKGGDGLTWVDRPILTDSSYVALADDGLDFDEFLSQFLASGSNKGLLVSLRDPRAVVPVFKALEAAVEDERLKSPIILDAEVLPGPGGHMPQMACVRTNSTAYQDYYIWRDGQAALEENDARTPPRSLHVDAWSRLTVAGPDGVGDLVPFDPVGFVRSAALRLPGAILSLGVATGGVPCAREKTAPPRKTNPAAGLAFPFQSAFAWHQRQRAMMHQRLRGAKVMMFGNVTGAAAPTRLPDFFTPAMARARRIRGPGFRGAANGAANATASVAAALGQHRAAAAAAAAAGGARRSRGRGAGRRKLAQMDFEVMAIAEAEQERERERAANARAKRAEDEAAARLNTYDAAGAARRLSLARLEDVRKRRHRAYGWDTGADLIALVRNGTWDGDAMFPVAACALPATAATAPGYLRELADARLGFSIVARGPVLFTEAMRVAMLSELDSSRAVIGSDLVRLPDGERLTERQIFVDPVVENPEEALESNEAEEALEEAAKELGADYAGAEEELLDEEESIWGEKINSLKSFVATYVAKYAGGGD